MMSAPTFVLGCANKMPRVIPGSTAIGLSKAALQQLRSTGSVSYSLIYDANLSRVDGRLDLVKQLRVSRKIVERTYEHFSTSNSEGFRGWCRGTIAWGGLEAGDDPVTLSAMCLGEQSYP